jgi:large subunit ribosomal protein L21e
MAFILNLKYRGSNMVTRKGTSRRKTRSIYSKSAKTKGKISLGAYFAKFNEGDSVVLKAEPAVHKGIYYRRFHGQVAKVVRKIGACYELKLKDGGKEKSLLVHPIHLKKLMQRN